MSKMLRDLPKFAVGQRVVTTDAWVSGEVDGLGFPLRKGAGETGVITDVYGYADDTVYRVTFDDPEIGKDKVWPDEIEAAPTEAATPDAGDTSAAIKARFDAANINAVCYVDDVSHGSGVQDYDVVYGEDPVYASSVARCYEPAIAEFFAHAASDVEWLLSENKRLQAQAQAAVAELAAARAQATRWHGEFIDLAAWFAGGADEEAG